MSQINTPEVTVDNKTYSRIPIKTHLVQINEPLMPIIEKYVMPLFKDGDFIAISEKMVTITQGRVVHETEVKEGFLAKLLVRGVKKYDNDIGFSHPKKMQVAINQAGYVRMTLAMIIGGITKIFGRHGDFYRIAGHRISEIDGFNPIAMEPFNHYAMLGPSNPDEVCNKIEKQFGVSSIIIDGNNINVEVLGMSTGLNVSKPNARLILLDNPMGQSNEMTPIILIRPK